MLIPVKVILQNRTDILFQQSETFYHFWIWTIMIQFSMYLIFTWLVEQVFDFKNIQNNKNIQQHC